MADLSAGASFDAVLTRLMRATAQDAASIVAPLPPSQRAHLAMFCYRRAHLQEIGLAIAATCDQHALMEAAPPSAAGTLIYAQSRQRPKSAERANGPRSRITVAKSASSDLDLAALIATWPTTRHRSASRRDRPFAIPSSLPALTRQSIRIVLKSSFSDGYAGRPPPLWRLARA